MLQENRSRGKAQDMTVQGNNMAHFLARLGTNCPGMGTANPKVKPISWVLYKGETWSKSDSNHTVWALPLKTRPGELHNDLGHQNRCGSFFHGWRSARGGRIEDCTGKVLPSNHVVELPP